MLRSGDVLAGDYVVDSLVGKGGMSCVYGAHLAEDPAAQVAIKELPATVRLASGMTVAQGISAQMNLMRRVDHPGVAKLLDAFRWEDSFYLVFEYVQGQSLLSLVASQGAQSEKTVLTWALELCEILGYLHGLTPPVVYRDMKPSNVLRQPSGALKLVDLGIAREFKGGEGPDKDTVAFGTQGYAPPEQYGGAQTDARADIYALGATLWHLLAGFPPPMEFPLPPVSQVNHQVSDGCQDLIARCTQLDREKRYQNCADVAADVRRLLKGQELAGPAQRLAQAFLKIMKPREKAAAVPAQQELFLENVPTTVLTQVDDRSTGELPQRDFFFVVVQSELAVHDHAVKE